MDKNCETCVVNGRVSITCKYCKSNGYAYHEPNPALGKQGERIIDISLTEDGFARCPTCGVLNMEQGRSKEHCEHYVRTGKDVRGSWITFKFQPAPTDARAKVTFDPSQEQPVIVTKLAAPELCLSCINDEGCLAKNTDLADCHYHKKSAPAITGDSIEKHIEDIYSDKPAVQSTVLTFPEWLEEMCRMPNGKLAEKPYGQAFAILEQRYREYKIYALPYQDAHTRQEIAKKLVSILLKGRIEAAAPNSFERIKELIAELEGK